MYTVKSNLKNEELDFHSFNQQFLEICNQHKCNGTTLAFALDWLTVGKGHTALIPR